MREPSVYSHDAPSGSARSIGGPGPRATALGGREPAVISEKEYQSAAFPELRALVEALDEYPDDLFAELAGDVLTLEFADRARFVVNSHMAARQIWLAAALRAWHFDWQPESQRWVEAKSGAELWATLEGAIAEKLGRTLPLARPER